ncbi:HugZ family protein [Thiohalocapsa marina]|uniref:HugZ family protein n=1 Tax=Thiohalocapsa marina TaxID=424902 RepID=A0A5M8FJ31_9GAMM|nr:DUF2470 domain-containing protein [Thiohalocapsa marina]KAA6183736.1 HugZ family protein [Thiohalocapsa marina]
MSNSEEQAHAARHLLASAFECVLSTLSLESPGYPFGSVVPYVLGQGGLPLFLLSHLSQHTKNLDADPRCGLLVAEAGDSDVQQRGRLSAVGNMHRIEPDEDAERYFAYFPRTRMYFEQLGFRFYRFTPMRFHWNGGFATARWFGLDRILRPNPLSREAQAQIVDHMNRDHRDKLRSYLGAMATSVDAVEMLGIDAEGIDLRVDGRLHRIALPRTISSAAAAREMLVEMARQVR